MPPADAQRSARLYQDTRERIVLLVSGLGDAGWQTPVPACPGWSIRDVVSHLAAVAEDWASGRLAGAPSDEETAEHVARYRDRDTAGLLDTWHAAAAQLERLAHTRALVPPLGDVVTHEHDIRAALDRPGARDTAAVRVVSDQLLTMLAPPVPLRVIVEDAEYRSGPTDGSEIRLRTNRFESVRWRTGRRSRAQLAAMDWSADPAPVLDHLYQFGPATADLRE
ncbi:maleylpyruvate isomerase family mycothiol-dependent enzyme [Mycobacterium sp. PS03-16]|uniref:maleylpyruvate isomerase family mycothiol-dependent enzyme n=1 Tax=Mycobacterium sp. PS03-16 TaxID=2559611 RepID=UPI001073AC26|nr:maleylpyruvate isomerase family mycothiol-dependent enzyme [Mycobacterium sp. PS03-16]TFV54889.1 maleylpyruvate isomerase family mycothiol-dependent enzyme [Mycobacterium sp. PS03-16]